MKTPIQQLIGDTKYATDCLKDIRTYLGSAREFLKAEDVASWEISLAAMVEGEYQEEWGGFMANLEAMRDDIADALIRNGSRGAMMFISPSQERRARPVVQ